MLNDRYYRRSFASTALFVGSVMGALVFLMYLTGIAGLIFLSFGSFLLLAYYYRWDKRARAAMNRRSDEERFRVQGREGASKAEV